MGTADRANRMASHYQGISKAIMHFALDKCGNCKGRVNCANRILKAGGHPNPTSAIHWFLTGTLCPMPKDKKKPGIIAKAMVQFLTDCSKCDKFEFCIGQFTVGISESPATPLMARRLRQCINCADFPKCVQWFIEDILFLTDRKITGKCLVQFGLCKWGAGP